MYSHMVHVQREGLQGWNIRVNVPGQIRQAIYEYYNSETVNVEARLREHDHHDMETWYCRDEASANALAMHLAGNLPGRKINVYKLEAVAQTAATPPVLNKYSEKGLLP